MPGFEGKVALISGAGREWGGAFAQVFAARGAIIAAHDLTPISLDPIVDCILAAGGQARGYVADLASKLALQTMLHEVLDDWGRVDLLLHCLGAAPRDPLLTMDEWDWRRTVDLNLTGPFLLTQTVARGMRAQGGGAILQVVDLSEASPAALPAKLALIGLTRPAADEFGAYNIRVNTLCRGHAAARVIPGLSTDPAALALHLCSPESNLTGEILSMEV